MAIIGLGLDAVEIHRIEEALDKHGGRFKSKIFTKGEIERCEARADSAACYAARFAAKEAFYKALPNSVESSIPFKSVEIVNHKNGNLAILDLTTGESRDIWVGSDGGR